MFDKEQKPLTETPLDEEVEHVHAIGCRVCSWTYPPGSTGALCQALCGAPDFQVLDEGMEEWRGEECEACIEAAVEIVRSGNTCQHMGGNHE